MVLSMAGFAINDALVKTLNGDLPTGQVMGVRGLCLSILIGIVVWRRGLFTRFREAIIPLVLLRGCMELGATLFFLSALVHLPYASISAILQSLPLAVTLGGLGGRTYYHPSRYQRIRARFCTCGYIRFICSSQRFIYPRIASLITVIAGDCRHRFVGHGFRVFIGGRARHLGTVGNYSCANSGFSVCVSICRVSVHHKINAHRRSCLRSALSIYKSVVQHCIRLYLLCRSA